MRSVRPESRPRVTLAWHIGSSFFPPPTSFLRVRRLKKFPSLSPLFFRRRVWGTHSYALLGGKREREREREGKRRSRTETALKWGKGREEDKTEGHEIFFDGKVNIDGSGGLWFPLMRLEHVEIKRFSFYFVRPRVAFRLRK